jgi:hypothetical protein
MKNYYYKIPTPCVKLKRNAIVNPELFYINPKTKEKVYCQLKTKK